MRLAVSACCGPTPTEAGVKAFAIPGVRKRVLVARYRGNCIEPGYDVEQVHVGDAPPALPLAAEPQELRLWFGADSVDFGALRRTLAAQARKAVQEEIAREHLRLAEEWEARPR